LSLATNVQGIFSREIKWNSKYSKITHTFCHWQLYPLRYEKNEHREEEEVSLSEETNENRNKKRTLYSFIIFTDLYRFGLLPIVPCVLYVIFRSVYICKHFRMTVWCCPASSKKSHLRHSLQSFILNKWCTKNNFYTIYVQKKNIAHSGFYILNLVYHCAHALTVITLINNNDSYPRKKYDAS
jgi:hypothetical protein